MTRLTHYALLVTLLLVAFFFRTHELAGLGLGLEHDEVAEWQIADGIRHGQHALFFKEAYGQEPLFLYLMAGSTALIGDNVMGVRFTSVFVAMLTLAAAYRLLRQMFSPAVALIAIGGLAIALWPVFWGRVALRAMTLPLMMCLGFDWLWRGLIAERGAGQPTVATRRTWAMRNAESSLHRPISSSLRPFLFSGVFFGLSAYTYLSSRALPILLAVFTVYVALFARDRMRGRWRGVFASYLVGGLIALPLVTTLLTNPDLQFRVSEVSGPLDKAVQGEWSEIGANVNRAMGMFTVKGDSTVRDNWPNRPVFPEPIGAMLFGAGVLISITRLRQPRYALALLWIGVMLIPTIVTTGAPNFTRTLGALPMVFVMPGIAAEFALFWLPRVIPVRSFAAMSRAAGVIGGLALIGVWGINAVSTYEDYFTKWPNHLETQFVFQADFAAIAKDIDASDVMDVSVGGLSNDTMDNPSLYLLRRRKDVRVRWFDSGSPISSGGAVIQAYSPYRRVYVPSIVPVSHLLENALAFSRTAKTHTTDHFTSYEIRSNYRSGRTPWAQDFEDTATLLTGPQVVSALAAKAGDRLQFGTFWVAEPPIAYPRRIFVHLVDPLTGAMIAQHDGLDSPTKYWREWDWITQIHTLAIPAGTLPGRYEVQIGLYDPTTNMRVPRATRSTSESPSDHVVLGTIQVVR